MVKNVKNLFTKITLPNKFEMNIKDFNKLLYIAGNENVTTSI